MTLCSVNRKQALSDGHPLRDPYVTSLPYYSTILNLSYGTKS